MPPGLANPACLQAVYVPYSSKDSSSSEHHLWNQHKMPLLPKHICPQNTGSAAVTATRYCICLSKLCYRCALCSSVLIIYFACVLFSWHLAEFLHHFHQDIGIFRNSVWFLVCWVMDGYGWSHWDDACPDKCAGISSLDDIMHLTTDAHTKLVVQMFSTSEIML